MQARGSWVSVLLVLGVGGAVVASQMGWFDRAVQPVPETGPAPAAAVPAGVRPPDARQPRCQRVTGEVLVRLENCLEDLQTSNLSKGVAAEIADLAKSGPVGVLARLPNRLEKQSTWSELPEASRAALLAADEAAAARLLREAGLRGLVVSRDLRGAVDEDSTVLSRLAHHNHLEWFQLRYVTEDLLVYTVRSSPARMPLATGDQLLKGLRARLSGAPVPAQSWKPESVRLLGALRLQGNTLAIRHSSGTNLEKVLDELADSLRRSWDRELVPMGLGLFEDRLKDVRIEVHIVMERAPMEPRSAWEIFDFWEMGVDGMMFKQREGRTPDKFTYMPGSELVVKSLHSGDEFLRDAVRRFEWNDLRPWEKDPQTQLDVIRTQHFMEGATGGGPAVRLVRGMPEVRQEEITPRRVQEMLISGGEWWLHNMKPDGSIEYKYWPEQNRGTDDYNEVRHILATRDLADVWRYRQDERYLTGARRAMDWLMRYAVRDTDPPSPPIPHPPEGTLLFRYPSVADAARVGKPPNQKLGTVAVGLLGWVAWARATGSHAEDDNIRRMARFVRFMMEEDGKYKPYFVQDGHAYEDESNDIVPGEAALALGVVAEYFGEKEWVEDYPKFVAYYKPWFKERAARTQPYGRWPRFTYENQDRLDLVEFGPWSVMAARQTYALTQSPEAAEFGLEVASWMIEKYQWSAARSPWPDYVGGYYKLPNELPAMQTFCYSEGTAAAYHLALMAKPEAAPTFRQATEQSIRFLEVMQFDPVDSYFVGRPEKVRGGIKYTMNENKIRIDYVGHGLSTLSQYLDAAREDPAVQFDVLDPAERAKAAAYPDEVVFPTEG